MLGEILNRDYNGCLEWQGDYIDLIIVPFHVVMAHGCDVKQILPVIHQNVGRPDSVGWKSQVFHISVFRFIPA